MFLTFCSNTWISALLHLREAPNSCGHSQCFFFHFTFLHIFLMRGLFAHHCPIWHGPSLTKWLARLRWCPHRRRLFPPHLLPNGQHIRPPRVAHRHSCHIPRRLSSAHPYRTPDRTGRWPHQPLRRQMALKKICNNRIMTPKGDKQITEVEEREQMRGWCKKRIKKVRR